MNNGFSVCSVGETQRCVTNYSNESLFGSFFRGVSCVFQLVLQTKM